MAGFDAGQVVESLDYDFTALPGLSDAKGTVPEPSDKAIAAFLAELGRIAAEAGKASDAVEKIKAGDPTATADTFLAALGEEMMLEQQDKVVDALARLCNGSPSREQLAMLPFRHRQAFLGWLIGQLVDPRGVISAMRR